MLFHDTNVCRLLQVCFSYQAWAPVWFIVSNGWINFKNAVFPKQSFQISAFLIFKLQKAIGSSVSFAKYFQKVTTIYGAFTVSGTSLSSLQALTHLLSQPSYKVGTILVTSALTDEDIYGRGVKYHTLIHYNHSINTECLLCCKKDRICTITSYSFLGIPAVCRTKSHSINICWISVELVLLKSGTTFLD